MGIGMVSEVFSSGAAKKEDYRYFVFVSSSVRGPFIPTYAMVRLPSLLNTVRASSCVTLLGFHSGLQALQMLCAITGKSVQDAARCVSTSSRLCRLQDDQHWTHFFTQKLTENVKLVGPTISCESRRGPEGEDEVVAPHVQFTAVATDQVHVASFNSGHLFKCSGCPISKVPVHLHGERYPRYEGQVC